MIRRVEIMFEQKMVDLMMLTKTSAYET